jgi:hypothetical protein
MRYLLLILALCAATLTAQKKGKTVEAHEHGTAKLDIAVDGNTVAIDFEAPAEGIVGFEHKAKSAADQTKQAAALDLFKTQFSNMVIFDPSLGCQFTPKKVGVVQEAGEDHSEVQAAFSLSCKKSPAGSTLRFGFTKVFPRIQTVMVQALSGSQPAGAEIKQDKGTVTLGR